MAPARVAVSFISFRGKDVRPKFISHLCTGLRREKRVRLVIDENFRRGRGISKEIEKAIKEADISIIVFSADYATSEWCLDEVALIVEQHMSKGQIVIVVFYHVSKTVVREQVGSFAAPFGRYEKKNPSKAKKWRAALSKVVEIGGGGHMVVSNRTEAKAVDGIVRDVIEKTNHLSFEEDSGLVGIEPRMEQVKHLLDYGSLRICVISIWGMGGVGKSKLSEHTYNQVCGQYDDFCVLDSFEEDQLQKLIYMKNKGCSDVLVLVNGVKNIQQVELLAELCDGFGVGSRIIVPTRNKQVFNGAGCKKIFEVRTYEVELLTSDEAFELLKLVAFDGNSPPNDYMDVIDGVIDYAGGNPGALKELGKLLRGRNKKLWKDALKKLQKFPIPEMHDVLMNSFKELDYDEQTIFLDIAFFFIGERIKYVAKLLNACNLDATNGITTLVERSLVYVKDGRVWLHRLHEATAREIVRKESPKDPTKRSRISNPEDILRVLDISKRSGQVKTRGLRIDLCSVKNVQLQPHTFSTMPGLTFLIFYDSCCYGGCGDHGNIVHALHGLDPFPRSLRLVHWHNYPLTCFPDAPELLDLQLPCSNLEELETDQHQHSRKQCILS